MDEKIFQEALSNFTADVAYVKAVRHLHDLGLPPEEIQKECTYPVSVDKILKAIEDYEKEKCSTNGKAKYVQDTDAYGKKSLRRVIEDK
ncbi:MAG: hypothetical protein HUJ71_08610 [Pseudobutyrivibrio sp.]|nr:hypothetical protein [Pseudobutyrivibrio sp.]